MKMKTHRILSIICLAYLWCASALSASVSQYWADTVIEYSPVSVSPVYTNATSALGPPARISSLEDDVTNYISVINPAYSPDDIVSLGNGGELTVRMGQAITNWDDGIHPYGVDLIVYGNSFFGYWIDTNSSPYASPWVELWEERAEIWLSNDGTNWLRARGVYADSYFPAQAMQLDGTPSLYRTPVNPALLTNHWLDGNWTYTNTVMAYDGAAGGTPVDLSNMETENGIVTNMMVARYVRFHDISGPGAAPEIDACCIVEDIPEPHFLAAFSFTVLLLWRVTRFFTR